MSIKHWPPAERPREKLLRHGAEHLSAAELLAIILQSGYKKTDAVTLARHLLKTFGSLSGCFHAPPSQLATIKGLGTVKRVVIAALCEINQRLLKEKIPAKKTLTTARDIVDACMFLFHGLDHERCYGAFLNKKNELIDLFHLSTGTATHTAAEPKQLFREALRFNASAVIIIHNHVSKNIFPSNDDMALTDTLVRCGKIVGIPLLDHLIINNGRFFSFNHEGLINYFMSRDCG